jgi:hypothetical protein
MAGILKLSDKTFVCISHLFPVPLNSSPQQPANTQNRHSLTDRYGRYRKSSLFTVAVLSVAAAVWLEVIVYQVALQQIFLPVLVFSLANHHSIIAPHSSMTASRGVR